MTASPLVTRQMHSPSTFSKSDSDRWAYSAAANPLVYRSQHYSSASAALDAYISAFEGRPGSGSWSQHQEEDLEHLLISGPANSAGGKPVQWTARVTTPDDIQKVLAVRHAVEQSYEKLQSLNGAGNQYGEVTEALEASRQLIDQLSPLPSSTNLAGRVSDTGSSVITDILLQPPVIGFPSVAKQPPVPYKPLAHRPPRQPPVSREKTVRREINHVTAPSAPEPGNDLYGWKDLQEIYQKGEARLRQNAILETSLSDEGEERPVLDAALQKRVAVDSTGTQNERSAAEELERLLSNSQLSHIRHKLSEELRRWTNAEIAEQSFNTLNTPSRLKDFHSGRSVNHPPPSIMRHPPSSESAAHHTPPQFPKTKQPPTPPNHSHTISSHGTSSTSRSSMDSKLHSQNSSRVESNLWAREHQPAKLPQVVEPSGAWPAESSDISSIITGNVQNFVVQRPHPGSKVASTPLTKLMPDANNPRKQLRFDLDSSKSSDVGPGLDTRDLAAQASTISQGSEEADDTLLQLLGGKPQQKPMLYNRPDFRVPGVELNGHDEHLNHKAQSYFESKAPSYAAGQDKAEHVAKKGLKVSFTGDKFPAVGHHVDREYHNVHSASVQRDVNSRLQPQVLSSSHEHSCAAHEFISPTLLKKYTAETKPASPTTDDLYYGQYSAGGPGKVAEDPVDEDVMQMLADDERLYDKYSFPPGQAAVQLSPKHKEYLSNLVREIADSSSSIATGYTELQDFMSKPPREDGRHYRTTQETAADDACKDVFVNMPESFKKLAGVEVNNNEKSRGAVCQLTPHQTMNPGTDTSPNTETLLDGDRPWERTPVFQQPVPCPVRTSPAAHASPKNQKRRTHLVDRFLEECMEDCISEVQENSIAEGGPSFGGMEVLKNMLFTMQMMSTKPAPNDSYSSSPRAMEGGASMKNISRVFNPSADITQPKQATNKSLQRVEEDVAMEMNLSTDAVLSPATKQLLASTQQPGSVSLERAMEHLSRLKSIVQQGTTEHS